MRQVSVSWKQSVCAVSDRCWVAKGHAHLNWMQEGSCVIRGLTGVTEHPQDEELSAPASRERSAAMFFILYTSLHSSKSGIGLLWNLKASRLSREQSGGQLQLPAGDPEGSLPFLSVSSPDHLWENHQTHPQAPHTALGEPPNTSSDPPHCSGQPCF